MNFNDVFGWVTTATDWIENVLINGLIGQGFQAILKAITTYINLKPILDFFAQAFAGLGL